MPSQRHQHTVKGSEASEPAHATMRSFLGTKLLPFFLLSALPAGVLSGNVLSTTGFSQCLNNPTIEVTNLNVTYNKDTRNLAFDVAGVSQEVQKVRGTLVVSAYGKTVYTKSFDPCGENMPEMCPG